MDSETKQLLSEAELLKLLTEHEGWGIARTKLLDLVASLSNIDTLNTTDGNQLILEVKANQKAMQLLIGWLKDIEGTVEQLKENTSLLPSSRSYIVRD